MLEAYPELSSGLQTFKFSGGGQQDTPVAAVREIAPLGGRRLCALRGRRPSAPRRHREGRTRAEVSQAAAAGSSGDGLRRGGRGTAAGGRFEAAAPRGGGVRVKRGLRSEGAARRSVSRTRRRGRRARRAGGGEGVAPRPDQGLGPGRSRSQASLPRRRRVALGALGSGTPGARRGGAAAAAEVARRTSPCPAANGRWRRPRCNAQRR